MLKASTQNGEAFNIIAQGLDWTYYGASVRPESTNYTANTAMQQIATANSNLDGSGTIGDVLTAASNGTLIQTVTVKAIVNTTAGMIRLYIYNGTTSFLLTEVPVRATTKSSTAHAFSTVLTFLNDFALKATYHLKASTEKAETFNIIAEGADWTYPA